MRLSSTECAAETLLVHANVSIILHFSAMGPYYCSSLELPEVELRLVILYPGESYDSVHCDIVVVTPDLLEEYEATYEALSYCWGKDVATNTIFIGNRFHQVTPNLEHALRHLRYRTTRRVLWIDALCINQRDDEEKNKQVPRMGWIYQNAVEVVIWIGNNEEKEDKLMKWDLTIWQSGIQSRGSKLSTALAFRFLENLAWYTRQSIANPHNFSHISMLVEMCKNAEYCANVARLLHREWFERMWVVQEAVLARSATISCGDATISWATLAKAITAMNNPELQVLLAKDHKFFVMIGQERVSRILECVHKRELFALLDATQASKFGNLAIYATNARDKLYGLLGIMSVQDSQDITVDYNMKVVDVYRFWAEKRIIRTGNLDVLSICANTRRRGMPSWVPDLDHRLPQDKTFFSVTHSVPPVAGEPPPTTKYHAAGPEPANVRFSLANISGQRQHVMELRGLKFFTIGFIAPRMTVDIVPYDGDIQDVLQQLESMLIFSDCGVRRMSKMPQSTRHKDRILRSDFVKTLFRGYSHSNITCSLEEMYECYRGRDSKPELLVTSWPPTRTQEFFSKFEHMLRNFLWDARFFVTSGGDFGVISDNCNAKEHDDIWILRGGRTPFIIRQIEGNWKVVRSTDTFELMGPCYVSGFMNGEKVSGGWQLSSSDDQNQTRWAHGLGMVADIKII